MKRDHAVLRWCAVPFIIVMAVLSSGCSNVVRLPDCGDCRPVEMGIDQTFEVVMESDRALGNDAEAYEWELVDIGTMTLVSQEKVKRSEDPTEFVGGYSYSWLFTLEPTATGTTQVVLHRWATDEPDGDPIGVLDITVIVDG